MQISFLRRFFSSAAQVAFLEIYKPVLEIDQLDPFHDMKSSMTRRHFILLIGIL